MKAILFDLVGVLLIRRAKPALSPQLTDIEKRLCLAPDDFLEKEKILQEQSLTEESFKCALQDIVSAYEPFQALWDYLPQLNSFRRAILNNGTRFTVPAFRNTFNLDDIFPVFINSSVVGLRKPQREIFEYASSILGVPLEECLYVDDSSELTKIASDHGIKTVCFENPEKGLAQLKRLIGV